MRVQKVIVAVVLAAMLGLQGWTLQEVNRLGAELAALKQKVSDRLDMHASQEVAR